MGNIVLFKGESQYNALRLFTDCLSQAFRQLGRQAVVIDFMQDDVDVNLRKVLTEEIAFVFSFNAIGIELSLGDELLVNKLNIPFVAGLVDHPYHHWERLHVDVNQLLVTCVDRQASEFLKNARPMAGIKGSAFVPHSGVWEDNTTFVEDISKRNIPALFCGTYQSPDAIFQDVSFPKHIRKVFSALIELALAQPGEALPLLAEKVLCQQDIFLDESFWAKLYPMLATVDQYIRAYKRQRTINRLIRDGIPIAVCGNGWEHFSQKDKLVVYKARSFAETVALMKQAKVCLEIDANFAYGGHERPLTAMLNHVPVLAGYNEYYRDNFVVDQEIVLSSLLDRYELSQRLTGLLEKPLELQQISEKGHDAVVRKHTYVQMAEKILTFVDTYKEVQQF